jgi:small subunit ribosomal protein S8
MYINLLIRLQNAQMAKKTTFKAPFSKMDLAIAELLERMHYVDAVAKKGRMPKRNIEVRLKYKDGKGIIRGIKLISKPSLRRYAKYQELRRVKNGFGAVVVSTSKGIMTGEEAKKEKLGGQILFEIW